MRKGTRAALLLLLFASCRGEDVDAPAAPASASTPAASTVTAPVKSPASDLPQLTSINEQNREVSIAFAENGEMEELFGEPRDDGKRKYTVGDGPVLYEIKPDNDSSGFKLRGADGKLRWKVKVSPDKIKISDNENNDRPFELKVKEGNRVKVVAPVDLEIGNVRYVQNQIEVEDAQGRVIYGTQSPKFSGAYGVLLCSAIPMRERYILVAELLSRGR
jgi:hypothetical protein